ncbi:hypothetical protein AU468_00025 [Alkalispirochaeta sphaeroplastigenens]|uniref:Uncharacterized protein n=1 Tax=Alkalispirochaeta sphaeroplastigenens TaxID=1187066 RepID=A0A2S4K1F9_9SPIO|nr:MULTISPECIES: hypothetical protein [Alkalispirochaeta]POR05600.1 hypothetical protein AU468_00025 [Alkalispirochaeta sphaeroplastigenens]
MRYIIRTTTEGVPLPVERIDAKRLELVRSILARGKRYLEYEALLGSTDLQGDRIEEGVRVVEEVDDQEVRYV